MALAWPASAAADVEPARGVEVLLDAHALFVEAAEPELRRARGPCWRRARTRPPLRPGSAGRRGLRRSASRSRIRRRRRRWRRRRAGRRCRCRRAAGRRRVSVRRRAWAGVAAGGVAAMRRGRRIEPVGVAVGSAPAGVPAARPTAERARRDRDAGRQRGRLAVRRRPAAVSCGWLGRWRVSSRAACVAVRRFAGRRGAEPVSGSSRSARRRGRAG